VKISASIIVFNEEENIGALLETLDWVDEIVVVDSFSTDRTKEIVADYNARVYDREFKGYQDKHEFADAQTAGDWIFWVDADERVTPELRQAIEKLKGKDQATLPDGFRVARKTQYLGKWIKHGGWYPDHQMRLYRKSASYWDGVAPHQTARVKGRTEVLPGELLHFTKRDLAEHHRVTNIYATLAAEHLAQKGHRAGSGKMFFSSVMAFLRTYLLKQGFRDGVQGMIIAMFTAYGVFLKYAKLWERNNNAE